MFPEVNGIIRCRKFFEREGHRGDEGLPGQTGDFPAFSCAACCQMPRTNSPFGLRQCPCHLALCSENAGKSPMPAREAPRPLGCTPAVQKKSQTKETGNAFERDGTSWHRSWKLGETLSRTGFTASAVNPFSSGDPRKTSLNCSGGTKQEEVGRWGGTSARLSDFFRVSCLEGGTV